MNAIYGIEKFHSRKENYQFIETDINENSDVCIIGSGAAGAILAKKLCDAGRSVILIEKGGYYDGEDMNQRDEDMFPLLWKNSGANLTDDLRIAIAQGSCLGGSTIINDAVCFDTPDIVRDQWRALGVDISDKEWDEATREVSDAIQVIEVREDELGANALMLKKGCEIMGFKKHYPNKRNSVNCMQCGLCHLGCHYGTKRDMRETYIHSVLNDAKSDISIYCNCSVEKIIQSENIVKGVEGNVIDRGGNIIHRIRVNAKLVIVAAGAIASTHLLQKNSIANGKTGFDLALHPSPFIIGDFPFEIKGIQGIPMTYTLHDFGVTNGVRSGGFIIEGIYLPPLQFSMLIPISGGMHLELMKRYSYYAMAGVLVRDGANGKITLTEKGFPRVTYSPGREELDSIAKGSEIIANMWFRLGATRVITSHISKPIINSEKKIKELTEAIKNEPERLLLGSAHPQGGNRMGKDPDICVVDSNGKVYGWKNLYICDASVLPTAVGVNPQLTVMSLAVIIANRINRGEFVSVEPEDKKSEIISKKPSEGFPIKMLILLLLAILIIIMVLSGEPIMPYLDRYIQMAIERIQNLLS
jgi:choline dehydrogenase-like flavoprotein